MKKSFITSGPGLRSRDQVSAAGTRSPQLLVDSMAVLSKESQGNKPRLDWSSLQTETLMPLRVARENI